MAEERTDQTNSTPAAATPPSSGGSPTTPPAADIFAGVDSTLPPPPPPAQPTPAATPAPRPLEPLEHLPELEAEDGRKKVFVWVGVAVAAAIVGVGGWFAYAQLLAPQAAVPATGEQPQAPSSPSEQPQAPATPQADDDFDRDGLTNAEEEQLQTDPYSADTDADGLYDREEVSAWHTDPLNPDTDGDGYLDGAEVANGYNPKGDGPLLELPTGTAP